MEIYQTPKTKTLTPKAPTLDRLKKEQSASLAVFISVLVTCGVLVLIDIGLHFIQMLVFLMPSLIAGIAVKIVARPFSIKLRAISATLSGLIVFSYLSLRFQTVNIYSIVIPALGAGVFMALSRRFLSHEQESALYKLRRKQRKRY